MELLFPDHVVLIGDNNTGKSTIFEAIDLALGPNRLNSHPVIDEHDFYNGEYLSKDDTIPAPKILIETTITDLSTEQRRHFKDYIEYWCEDAKSMHTSPPPSSVDTDTKKAALRISFMTPTVDFDPGPSVFNLTTSGVQSGNIFILKLNAAGDFVWAAEIGSIVNDSIVNVGHSLIVPTPDNIYTVGQFRNTVDFDPGPGVFTLTAPGPVHPYPNEEAYILKLGTSSNCNNSQTYSPVITPLSSTNICVGDSVILSAGSDYGARFNCCVSKDCCSWINSYIAFNGGSCINPRSCWICNRYTSSH